MLSAQASILTATQRAEGAGERSGSFVAPGVLLVVLLFGAARDLFVLLRYPVALGFDGYYYVPQVQELLSRGQLYFTTSTPFVFYPLAALAALTGEAVLAVKIGSVALHIALCVGLYALVSSVTRSRWLGVLAATIAAVSAMHFYMLAEFIKNLCGLALLIWCWWGAVSHLPWRDGSWILQTAGYSRHGSVLWPISCCTALLAFLS
jgi:fucose 4-O-acetylase-like acetyltransferase